MLSYVIFRYSPNLPILGVSSWALTPGQISLQPSICHQIWRAAGKSPEQSACNHYNIYIYTYILVYMYGKRMSALLGDFPTSHRSWFDDTRSFATGESIHLQWNTFDAGTIHHYGHLPQPAHFALFTGDIVWLDVTSESVFQLARNLKLS